MAKHRLQRFGHWSLGAFGATSGGLLLGYEYHNWVAVGVVHFFSACIFFGLARLVDGD